MLTYQSHEFNKLKQCNICSSVGQIRYIVRQLLSINQVTYCTRSLHDYVTNITTSVTKCAKTIQSHNIIFSLLIEEN